MNSKGATLLYLFLSLIFGFATSYLFFMILGYLYYLVFPCFGTDCFGAMAFVLYGFIASPVFMVGHFVLLTRHIENRKISFILGIGSILLLALWTIIPKLLRLGY